MASILCTIECTHTRARVLDLYFYALVRWLLQANLFIPPVLQVNRYFYDYDKFDKAAELYDMDGNYYSCVFLLKYIFDRNFLPSNK